MVAGDEMNGAGRSGRGKGSQVTDEVICLGNVTGDDNPVGCGPSDLIQQSVDLPLAHLVEVQVAEPEETGGCCGGCGVDGFHVWCERRGCAIHPY